MFIRRARRVEYATPLRRLPSVRPARMAGALHEPGAASIRGEVSTYGRGPPQGLSAKDRYGHREERRLDDRTAGGPQEVDQLRSARVDGHEGHDDHGYQCGQDDDEQPSLQRAKADHVKSDDKVSAPAGQAPRADVVSREHPIRQGPAGAPGILRFGGSQAPAPS